MLFDFDDLEEQYEAKRSAAEVLDRLSDDSVSEVWPGESFSADEFEDPEGELHSHRRGGLEVVAHHEKRCDEVKAENINEEQGLFAWEVVVSRLIVRSEPSLDAPMTGIGSQLELFFERLPRENPDWIRLDGEEGFVLKDGRRKDPKLGLLLRPFEFETVQCPRIKLKVLTIVRDVWVEARFQNRNFLKPPAIRRLRSSLDEALQMAKIRSGAYDLVKFREEFESLARSVNDADIDVPERISPPPCGKLSCCANRATPCSAVDLLARMRRRELPNQNEVVALIKGASSIFAAQPTLVELAVPAGATLHVVGDLHGQYWDLLHILDEFGPPSPTNWYLFNGDLVDRGKFSVEVVLALFALKIGMPDFVHLNRGNHESLRMNVLYGFRSETLSKYSEQVFSLFCEAFIQLPLATVVCDSVLVVHGGLPQRDGVKLHDIGRLERKRDLDEGADDLMMDLLWSDPMDRLGRERSPRGAGGLFGPDVTRRFCNLNGLACVIRSHEMKMEGFQWHHEKRCLTVFSAPNYCDTCGNAGAVCDIVPVRSGGQRVSSNNLQLRKFAASPHPFDRSVAIPAF